jgi:hypothetical protein
MIQLKFYIFADEILVGWSEFSSGDPPMGVASGPFHPNEAYEQIRPLILECQRYSGINGVKNEQLFLAALEKLNIIRFRVQAEDGYDLHPMDIEFIDFSDMLDQDPYEVSLLGLPHDEYTRYFLNLYQQYFGEH